ncbi:MAG: peptide chain release factor N(5)-glutamine methyltransferase [Candidatus Korobacteraceae bacterium]|jgi:release factor glutamine methyltransferase
MQLRQALTDAVRRLEDESVGSPRVNGEMLLMFTLDCDRAYLYAHSERELTVDEQSRYECAIEQRASGYPAQYITGHQEFWGLDLIVTPAVLIPRPETEHVVETTLDLVRAGAGCRPGRGPKLIDVGTGSGAIALALATELPAAEIYGVDLSREALDIAKANAARLQLGDRVRFLMSDVLESVPRDGSFDFVLSNPPYVGFHEADKVQDVVKKFEPKMAVFAGEHGLDVIRRLIPQAGEALHAGGYLVFEIGYTMASMTAELLSGWRDVHAVPDLSGIPRVMVAMRP